MSVEPREHEAVPVVAPADEALSPVEAAESVRPWRRVRQRFARQPVAMVALAFLVLVVLVALLAPWIEPQDPNTQHLTSLNQGPSAAHWLGTDDLGRDILSRVIAGARVSMRVSLSVVVLATLVALPLGLVAGYLGRWVDAVVMRAMDALFTVPPLVLALAIAALLGPSLTNAAIAISVAFVPGLVRLVRAQVLAVREEQYIEASRSVGVSTGRMLRRHVLPNVVSPLVVQVALAFGYALLAEAGLSFLGLGVQPPNASWGTMLRSAYDFILDHPWPLFPPGLMIMATVLAFNLVGDGLRDSLGREVHRVRESR